MLFIQVKQSDFSQHLSSFPLVLNSDRFVKRKLTICFDFWTQGVFFPVKTLVAHSLFAGRIGLGGAPDTLYAGGFKWFCRSFISEASDINCGNLLYYNFSGFFIQLILRNLDCCQKGRDLLRNKSMAVWPYTAENLPGYTWNVLQTSIRVWHTMIC